MHIRKHLSKMMIILPFLQSTPSHAQDMQPFVRIYATIERYSNHGISTNNLDFQDPLACKKITLALALEKIDNHLETHALCFQTNGIIHGKLHVKNGKILAGTGIFEER